MENNVWMESSTEDWVTITNAGVAINNDWIPKMNFAEVAVLSSTIIKIVLYSKQDPHFAFKFSEYSTCERCVKLLEDGGYNCFNMESSLVVRHADGGVILPDLSRADVRTLVTSLLFSQRFHEFVYEIRDLLAEIRDGVSAYTSGRVGESHGNDGSGDSASELTL
jgi:hypothetical protein